MKHIGISVFGFVLLAIPVVLFAQTNGLTNDIESFIVPEDPTDMLQMISLWSMLIVAFVTSVMVWVGGRHMHGGVFGKVLTFFSIGMTLIFLGIATEVPWLENFDHLYLKMIHDSLYIIGYVMMGIAASSLLRVIKGA